MKNIFYILALMLVIGCTAKFEDYNRNPYGATDEDLSKIPQGGNQLIELQKLVVPEQENSYQMCFDLAASPYSGYASQPKFRSDYPTYNPRAGWVEYVYEDTYPKIYKQVYELRSLAKGDESKQFFALGSILRVAITHWLTDTYGALPYSQMEAGRQRVPYDTQKELYLAMCEDLEKAVTVLKKVDASDREYAPFDLVYGGDMTKWIKYANSLLLRLAVRMSDVDEADARKYAQFALENGVITQNSDNAQLSSADNSVYKMSHNWGDSVTGADITEYMNAFEDPRREKFFTTVEFRSPGKRFFGMSSTNKNISIDAANYSKPNIKQNSPIVWITAAEVAFIKAELRLKNIITEGSAKDLYEQGIRLSFEQWGANLGDYLSKTTTRNNFSDELATGFNTSFHSDITVNWDDANNDSEKQLSKIITQKWIAMYPYGVHEAWAEWRRTGYPNMLPVVTNDSGGVISSVSQSNGKDQGGMRRLPYPQKEYNENRGYVIQAVSTLGGADNGATDMWWVKK